MDLNGDGCVSFEEFYTCCLGKFILSNEKVLTNLEKKNLKLELLHVHFYIATDQV